MNAKKLLLTLLCMFVLVSLCVGVQLNAQAADETGAETPAIKLYARSLLYKNMVQVRFIWELDDGAEAEVYQFNTLEDAENLTTENATRLTLVKNSGGYYYTSDTAGISAKDMANELYVRAYYLTADAEEGWTDVCTYSPRTYAVNIRDNASAPAVDKSAVASLMHYGAAAQVSMALNAGQTAPAGQDLMNYGFGDLELDESKLPAANPLTEAEAAKTNGFTLYLATMLFNGEISYKFVYEVDPAVVDVTQPLELEYIMGDTIGTVVLTRNSADNHYWEAVLPSLPVKDLTDCYVQPYGTGVDGAKVSGVSLDYSASRYIGNICQQAKDAADDEKLAAAAVLAKALFVYQTDVKVAVCRHPNKVELDTTPATCGAAGKIIYGCDDCGRLDIEEVIPATGEHTWNDGEVTTPATCVEPGVKTYTCSVCQTTKTEAIPATGEHTWDDGVVTTPATCVDAGVRTYTCRNCDATKTEEIPATGKHTYVDGACSVCGAVEPRVIKFDLTTGYNNSQEMTTVTLNGVTLTFGKGTGSNPPKYYTSGTAVRFYAKNTLAITGKGIVKIVITFGSGGNGNALTADKDGNVTGTTTSTWTWEGSAEDAVMLTSGGTGGHIRIQTIEIYAAPCTGHVWNDGEVTTPATCETAGEKTYTCTVCGETKTEEIEATGHDWDAGVITKEATCGADGEKTFTCGNCHTTRTETIGATGAHTPNAEWEKDDTDHWQVCSVCSAELNKAAHTYENGVCSVCGAHDPDACAHETTEWVHDETEHWQACAKCGTEIEGTRAAHNKVETVDTPATCVDAGVKTIACDCGWSTTEEISATGEHVAKDGYESDATDHWQICATCNAVINKVAHTYENGVCACGAQQPSGGTISADFKAGSGAVTDGMDITAKVVSDADLQKLISIIAKKNGYTGNAAYLGSSYGIRLYPKSGNGSSVVLSMTDGAWVIAEIKITFKTNSGDSKVTVTADGTVVSVGSSEGVYTITGGASSVTIQNTASSGNVEIYSIEITYKKKVVCTEHTWNDGEVTTPATCETAGEKTYTCTVCGETKTEEIEATGHDWDDGVITKEATCGADGEKTFTCGNCQTTRTETIGATGEHTPNAEWEKDDTDHWQVCSGCGAELNKAAHTYENGVCSVCGAHDPDACAHETTEWVHDETNHWKVCSNCGSVIDGTTAAHDRVETVDTPATCVDVGVKTIACDCGWSTTEEISATGEHVAKDGYESNATDHWQICSVCSAELNKTAHTYDDDGLCVCGKEKPAEPTMVTIDFTDANNRTSYDTTSQVWEQNGITFTNKKASSSSWGQYTPIRCYAKSTIEIACANMTKIVIHCTSASYASAAAKSITIDGATVTTSGSDVTIEFTSPVSTTGTITLTAQVRINSIDVYHI